MIFVLSIAVHDCVPACGLLFCVPGPARIQGPGVDGDEAEILANLVLESKYGWEGEPESSGLRAIWHRTCDADVLLP